MQVSIVYSLVVSKDNIEQVIIVIFQVILESHVLNIINV